MPPSPTEEGGDIRQEGKQEEKQIQRRVCAGAACSRKLRLAAYPCKCGQTFCAQHTPPEAHACAFDYKGTARAQIACKNPQLSGSTLVKIS